MIDLSPSDAPIADLGPDLYGLLLRSLLWLSVGALALTGAAWLLARSRTGAGQRTRAWLTGRSATQAEPSGRRFLRIALGLLWVLDGLLQAQPDMPAGFVRDMIAPGAAASPDWLASVVNSVAGAWTDHPVTADAATVWIQIGLGVWILAGGRGVLSRVGLWTSLGWSLFVWVFGEFLGGLLAPGASWLAGSPGPVLIYAAAALLLLLPWSWWESGRCATLVRRVVAGWLLIGAVLQAVPWEGSWSAAGLSEPFANGVATKQPAALRQPIVWMLTLSRDHPAAVNAVLVVALAGIALGLWWSRRVVFAVTAFALCALTWWLAQDFGVLGGVGTDPQAALPLALLLAAALPRRTTGEESARAPAPEARRPSRLRAPVAAGAVVLGIGATVLAPLTIVAAIVGPPDAAAVAADSGGGVLVVPDQPTPRFALPDQNGKTITSGGLQGKLTMMTFLDPVCSDDCPLIANQLAQADRELGSLAKRVQIVAVDTNPVFHHISDVAAFTTSHGLAKLPNWHFLAGPVSTLQSLAADYGIAVQVPTVGMIEHGEGIFFLSASGREVAYLGDGANSGLTTTYAHVVRNEVRRLLA